MRHEGKPCLEYQCNDTSPVEQKIRGEVLFHIVKVNMIHDKRKCMKERKDEESIRNPSVEDLQSLVGYASTQRNPVGLGCGSTTNGQHYRNIACIRLTYNTNGIHASAIHPDLVPSGGEPPNFLAGQ
jgi:hypothetical protein